MIKNLENNIKNKIRFAKKIESNNNSDTLGIGDVVKIKTYTDIFEDIYELTSCENDFNCDIPKISINSPLGRALFCSIVGTNVSYKLKNENISVEIIERIKVKKKELVNE